MLQQFAMNWTPTCVCAAPASYASPTTDINSISPQGGLPERDRQRQPSTAPGSCNCPSQLPRKTTMIRSQLYSFQRQSTTRATTAGPLVAHTRRKWRPSGARSGIPGLVPAVSLSTAEWATRTATSVSSSTPLTSLALPEHFLARWRGGASPGNVATASGTCSQQGAHTFAKSCGSSVSHSRVRSANSFLPTLRAAGHSYETSDSSALALAHLRGAGVVPRGVLDHVGDQPLLLLPAQQPLVAQLSQRLRAMPASPNEPVADDRWR